MAFSTKEIEATYYNLRSLLLTNWGERPNHFFLGANLIEFVFAPANQETKDKVQARIISQVESWLPYVLLNNVNVEISDQDPHRIMIQVDFGIKGRQDLNSVLEVAIEPQ